MHLSMFITAKPDGKTYEEWEFEHEQVCGFIRQFVDDNVYNHICNETHAQKLWNKFEQLMGINFDDEVFAPMVLASLPESWETLKISITNTAPNSAVNMEIIPEGGASIGSKGLKERVERSQINMPIVNAITIRRRVTSKSSAESSRVNRKRTKANFELVPPTPAPRQVGDEGQVDEPDEDDAPIEVGSEDEEDDVHQPAPTPMASPWLVEFTCYNERRGAWVVQVRNTCTNMHKEYVGQFLVVATGENSEGIISDIPGLNNGFGGTYSDQGNSMGIDVSVEILVIGSG
ncbi:hypothetical protein JRO89_XS07G0202700 [Xanthoceras sorbifolium]|uniref:Uncharacterized protein n=1 Tax=Xanthoceras sorbifolium TaxID=99658 RepID=A0ABQ8HUM2_9ROSI|nr:hypothetical protein JRO89_XS07G0202700 [Xanthoceras sorbifolium]